MKRPGSKKKETPTFEIEESFLNDGHRIIAGFDEAGRGALAGHLSVGVVVYKDSFIRNPSTDIINNVRDSKKLSPARRIEVLEIIRNNALYAGYTLISNRAIDKTNINIATHNAILRLLKKIPFKTDLAIMDGNFKFKIGIPFCSVVKGDLKSISIASASIIAKVARDKIIEKFDLIYPGYSFKKNKGYATAAHIKIINEMGPSPIHRKTYEPIRSLLECGETLF